MKQTLKVNLKQIQKKKKERKRANQEFQFLHKNRFF